MKGVPSFRHCWAKSWQILSGEQFGIIFMVRFGLILQNIGEVQHFSLVGNVQKRSNEPYLNKLYFYRPTTGAAGGALARWCKSRDTRDLRT